MVNVMVMMFPSFQDHQQISKYLLIINHGFRSDQILIVFVIILSSLWTCHVAAAPENRDTLKVGDTLNSSSSSALVSASGKFTLFFLTNDSSSNYSYLYIRRANISGANKGWVANRDTPVLYPFGVLTLDTNNTLKIITTPGASGDPPVSPIVLGSAPKSSNTVVAKLLDSGNFILQELNSDGSTKQVWWQSFDYPTDTFLPGMKLGVNHSNGHIWSLTSWTSVHYLPPGNFTLDWDPNARQLEIRKQGVVYWRSGNFSATSNRFEFILPDIRVSFHFSIVSNENEDYLTYTSEDDGANIPEWLMNFDGELYNYYGAVVIAQADKCQGYSTGGLGCQTIDRPPNCTVELSNQFEHKKGYFKSSTSSSTSRCPYSLNFVSNGSYSGTSIDCNTTCLQDCDCLGFDFRFDNQTGCQFWSVDCDFIENLTQPGNASSLVLTKLMPTTKSSPPPKSPPLPPLKNGATHKWIWIGVAVSAAVVVLVFPMLCYLRRRSRKSKLSGEDKIDQNELLSFMNSNRPIDLNIFQNDGKMGHDLSVFSYASVMAATSNFAEENKLGEGGFGPVYKIQSEAFFWIGRSDSA